MHLTSLRYPDLLPWRDDRRYSERVRPILTKAYKALKRAATAPARYEEVVALVEPILPEPMSARQRIRAYYALGSSFAAVGEYAEARYWLDKAVELAYGQGDPGDLLDLLYLRGATNRGALRYADAAVDYREFLALSPKGAPFRADALDATLTLDVALQLAGAEFFRGHYSEAERLLDLVGPLLPSSPSDTPDVELKLAMGTRAWFQALLYRWRGMPDLALLYAATAVRIYTEFGSAASAARSQVALAEITLDIAGRAQHPSERKLLAAVAQPHIDAAQQLAASAGDPIGDCLCQLLRARLSRLSGLHEDRLAAIERVANVGQRLADAAIVAAAFTELGNDLAASGNVVAAAQRYADVSRLLDGSDIPAVGVWARRAGHRLAEEHPDL